MDCHLPTVRFNNATLDSWAIIDPVANRIDQVAGEAWRWLGWNGIDTATGKMERWPAETFGPLPEWTPPPKTGIIEPKGSATT